MARSDDLTSLLVPSVSGMGLRFSQGTILSWDPETFSNTVLWNTRTLTNVPVAGGVDALGFGVGDVVGLIGWSPGGGASSWWILGQFNVPPLNDPVTIKGGDLIVEGGAAIIVRHANGSPGAVYGNLASIGTGGAESGLGLLIQTDSGEDILRVKVDSEGQSIVALSESGQSIGQFTATADVISLNSTGSNLLFGGFVPGTSNFESSLILSDTGAVSITSETDAVFIDHGIFGGTANAAWSGDLLFEISSSRRYKTDIRDYRIRPKTVLDLQPRTWRDKSEVERNPDTDRWHVGFIAEELHDAGLTAFVDYDTDGQPKAVTYDRLCVALLEHNRHLQNQVEALTTWATGQGYRPPAESDVEPTVLPERRQVPRQTAKQTARQAVAVSDVEPTTLPKRMPSTDPNIALREPLDPSQSGRP